MTSILGAAEKKAFLHEHFTYELDMLKWAYDTLMGVNSYPRSWGTDNALIECFAIHARNLDEFFSKSDKEHVGGLACAVHFADSTYKPKGLTKDLKDKIQNSMAHLNYRRSLGDSIKINPADRAEIVRQIGEELDRFMASILPEFRVPID